MEELEADAIEDYENALNELTCNSKPHINMLTMLADEKKKFASKIVQIIETRINQVYIIKLLNYNKTNKKKSFAQNKILIFFPLNKKPDLNFASFLWVASKPLLLKIMTSNSSDFTHFESKFEF